MEALKFEDLLEEAKTELNEKGLPFVAKDGKTVILRPVLLLNGEELKVIQTLLKVVGDDKADTFDRLAAMDNMLIASADKKDSFKKSLADLPPKIRSKVFDAWMKAGKAGEASA